MPELIDKAKLIEYLAAIKPESYVSAYGEAAVDVINHVEKYVAEMPTIEPEVRRGRWQFLAQKNGYLWKCSACKGNFDQQYRFCPYCGALMQGGADNGN